MQMIKNTHIHVNVIDQNTHILLTPSGGPNSAPPPSMDEGGGIVRLRAIIGYICGWNLVSLKSLKIRADWKW